MALNIGAGFLFGPYVGIATAASGMALGVSVTFIAARYRVLKQVKAKVTAFKYYRVSQTKVARRSST